MADTEETGLEGRTAELPLGVVIRKQPGVTRWAKWVWRPVAVLPGAGTADWHEMRRDGEAVEYHAATCTLEVHRKETEGYRVALSNEPPCVYVILRPSEDPDDPQDVTVFGVTASAFEAQDYMDSGEEIVEKALPNAFAGTRLSEVLEGIGKRPLILAGFMTHMCVSATARAALDLGHSTTVAMDATATRDLPDPTGGVLAAGDVHRAALAAIADRFAVVVAAADIPD